MDRSGPPAEGHSGRDAGTAGRGDPGERPEAGRAPGRWRPGGSDRGDAGPARPGEMTGGPAAAAARGIRGGPARAAGKDGKDRSTDDALWARAAAWQAAAQARRQGRGGDAPYPPSARREPFRPWFTASADKDPWLNAEGTGEPWFLSDEP